MVRYAVIHSRSSTIAGVVGFGVKDAVEDSVEDPELMAGGKRQRADLEEPRRGGQ